MNKPKVAATRPASVELKAGQESIGVPGQIYGPFYYEPLESEMENRMWQSPRTNVGI